ncbi:hypothetical protein SAMN00120144_2510 [Hymenobacter roseosalivarius DSM 11622]|uniref:Helix-turn-helix domain-containing protein n=1 Tax=Hymenobacter roseosalivarius DSM 11622 TaxID=645990 RepID=A0A1W1VG31_9BACT|nr:helix-turn-helix domain-containing protein [Hymenobacter roseosalivarius]SMB92011.1 hypothetical protein SAMN00120144_2510 [Hymenobacter roseosalivarius DSM 11622]
MMTWADLQATMQQSIVQALSLHQQQLEADRRLTTDEAAKFLGVKPEYLQRLHHRGLAYEKGRPNRYRLADLQDYQDKQRLHRR